jgi:hypothetical protein
MQGYWSARAREKGLLKESDLDRFLRRFNGNSLSRSTA